jgi:hypothetical protein
MKFQKIVKSPWKITLILGALMMILPGCLDIWITTQIRPDGSLEQIVVFQGDSTEIADVQFAFINDGDWKKEWTKPEKDKYKLVLSKEFKSVKELNKTMNPADTNLQVVRINASLQRKFRWFFTRYEYAETILNANPFQGLDCHKYLTDEEIRLIALTEEARKTDPGFDSVKYKVTEKQFEDYIARSIYEYFYRQLETVLAENKSFTLSKQELDSKKEYIFKFLVDSAKGEKPDEILLGIERAIGHPDIQLIRSKYLNRFDGFQKKLDFFNSASDDNYKMAIRMPGLLLQTNSPKIEGSETGWELTYYNFFFKEYTMTAESRKVNTWAFIVAGLVLLAALASMVVALLRKR